MLKRAALALSLCATTFTYADSITVVGSIKPISLILSDIAGDLAEVETLLPPGASPHDFVLKPSDRRLLEKADLLVWSGPMTEPYLQRVIAASDTRDLAWIADEEKDESDHGKHEHEHEHEAHGHDELHPWLAPDAALEFAELIAHELSELKPSAAETIEANLAEFKRSLEAMDQANIAKLEPVKERSFVVFHDAYKGIVEHYGLNQVAAFTLDPSRKPGARHLQSLRDTLTSEAVNCVFIEPQFEPAALDAITRGMDIARGELDPLASTLEPGPGGYIRFVEGLVTEMTECLSN